MKIRACRAVAGAILGAAVTLAGCSGPDPTPIDLATLRSASFTQIFENCCDVTGGIPQWVYDYIEVSSIWVVPATRDVVFREAFLIHNEAAQAHILSEVQPIDVVLIRNESRLSGRTSDGWFSHSAVYVGGEAELRDLGVWDDPIVTPYHSEIQSGKFAIESVGDDVSLAGGHLFEADSMVVLRPQSLTRARKRQIVLDLFSNIGVPFDYYFRMNNGPALFCTELIDLVMPELDLPIQIVKGHDVILPDEVVIAALTGTVPMDFVTYIDGRRDLHTVSDAYHMAGRIVDSWPNSRPD